MTFAIQCPQCGASLGNGYHQSRPDGKEQLTINLTAVNEPPLHPQPESPQPPQGNEAP